MPKLITTLDATAYHEWKTREGLRDILQNGRDAAITGAKVLAFDIGKGRVDRGRVQVEVGGVDTAFWKAFKAKFLFLDDPGVDHSETRVTCPSGTLLLDPQYRGDVYVKGIWVLNDDQLEFGYDFHTAKTDRDRKMVDNAQTFVLRLWREAMARRPDLIARFVGMFSERVKDVEGIGPYLVTYYADAVRDAVVKDFRDKHGEDAIPVLTTGESEEVEHLGRRAVVVSRSHLTILETVLGNVATLRAKLATEVTRTYSWAELSIDEHANFQTAFAVLNFGVRVDLRDVDIVDYRDPALEGMHLSTGNRIQVAKRCLADTDKVLEVLVHEKAHDAGEGEQHLRAVERIWSAIAKHLRAQLR